MAQSLAEIRAMLAERGLSPRRRFGQNFLIDRNLVARLADASGAGAGDLVLEVGPGTGTLTEALLGRGCEVVACELDRGLAALLRERLGGRPGFTLVEGDCLAGKRDISGDLLAALGGRPFRLVANLPYGAASPLILALLTRHPECLGQFVTIQREVGERLTARPATPAYGSIGVVAQTLASVRVLATLPPECFWPRPEVTSVMVSLEPRAGHGVDDPPSFADFCQRALSGRRKQLGSVLGRGSAWPTGVSPTDRAESLAPERFVDLWRAVGRGEGAG